MRAPFVFGLVLFAVTLSAAPSYIKPPKLLSAAGLYSDIVAKEINPVNRSYSPQYPLWSDGAKKARWVRLPAGERIDTSDMQRWKFPVGTRFWKEFSFKDPQTGKVRRIETRMIEKAEPTGSGAWKFYTYLWNAEETEAALDVLGKGKEGIFATSESTSHDVPNRTDCLACHGHDGDLVMGFNALQLSWDRDPLAPHAEPFEKGMIGFRELMEEKLVTHGVPDAPRIRARTPVARAALGYVDSNCGGCHSPGGNAAFTGMLLWASLDADSDDKQPAHITTMNQPNVRYTDMKWRIAAGQPALSAVITRMATRGKAFPRMPNLGTSVVDTQALKLLTKWIQDAK